MFIVVNKDNQEENEVVQDSFGTKDYYDKYMDTIEKEVSKLQEENLKKEIRYQTGTHIDNITDDMLDKFSDTFEYGTRKIHVQDMGKEVDTVLFIVEQIVVDNYAISDGGDGLTKIYEVIIDRNTNEVIDSRDLINYVE